MSSPPWDQTIFHFWIFLVSTFSSIFFCGLCIRFVCPVKLFCALWTPCLRKWIMKTKFKTSDIIKNKIENCSTLYYCQAHKHKLELFIMEMTMPHCIISSNAFFLTKQAFRGLCFGWIRLLWASMLKFHFKDHFLLHSHPILTWQQHETKEGLWTQDATSMWLSNWIRQ